MPASRKRKPKPAAQHGKPPLTAAIVPTRRQRETYLEATPPEARQADLDAANAVMGRRTFKSRSNDLIAQAYVALDRSPLCVDAYIALSEETRDVEQSLDYLKRAINAGELALGELTPAETRSGPTPRAGVPSKPGSCLPTSNSPATKKRRSPNCAS
jgi:hypothetical protein